MYQIIRRECRLLTHVTRAWLHASDETSHVLIVTFRLHGIERTRAKMVALREARRFCRRHHIHCPESVSARLVAAK